MLQQPVEIKLNGDKGGVDAALLENFKKEIWNKAPHMEGGGAVANATPLIDITDDLRECARKEFGLNLDGLDLRVFGKYDSKLLGGSIKARPAINIIHDAIMSGRIGTGQTVIEATSGNFGIALGLLSKLGLNVVALVSRKLQEGVFEELRNERIRIINLDMDICPAPGMKESPNVLAARATAANIRSQLSDLGFDPEVFDRASSEVQSVLAAQDIIGLAKILARIYGCFCPEQYDNQLNIEVHRTVTGPEIDQQLHEKGLSLDDFRIVCTFGTGGTSGGLCRYLSEKYGKKSLHVVFPLSSQDVAGIRTKGKASGLRFYEPERYGGQHEVDFGEAKRLLRFFVDKGHDMGESSALALYSVMQMANFASLGSKFVVIIADGIQKYRKNLEAGGRRQSRIQVSMQEAASSIGEYDKIIWVHPQYTPREEGIELIAKTLGVDKSKVVVPKARDVERLLSTQQIPEGLDKALEGSHKSLLVCMAGFTSLNAVKVLADKGISTESLTGGISALSEGKGKQISELIKVATE
ncbi:MAG: pyridoxal-phosphate dependent enzyme [Thaumarchaeota archaeon]|nr:pyridoxal-phosphate dependent enzyme [Nitrososphaerota archaeon]